jgi:hypothetical protein
MNREQAIRTGFYQALNGNLTYNSNPVSITDSILTQGSADSPVYVVFDQQTANLNTSGAFRSQIWDCTINVFIISKQTFSVSKEILDTVAEQVETIVIPTVNATNVIAPTGWQFTNMFLQQVNFKEVVLSATQSIIGKTLTFSLKVVKQS